VDLIARAARENADHVAVVSGGKQISYGELERRSNQLGNYLRRKGVGVESRVGVCMERSPDLIIGILGILKAGGVYVPLDPANPRERLLFILNDANIELLLTQAELSETFDPFSGEIVCLDMEWSLVANDPETNQVPPAPAESLAYVIYTSGSTGAPKGVMIEHSAMLNYMLAAAKYFDIASCDRVLQFCSASFDTSLEEIFPCLLSGATLVLRSEETIASPYSFIQYCGDMQVTVADLPTAYWRELVGGVPAESWRQAKALRLMILGGEKVLESAARAWFLNAGATIRLVNSYGPTEGTIVSTICDLDSSQIFHGVPIGWPVNNVRVYNSHSTFNLMPVGTRGELVIAGSGLARGYLNHPELTAEKFVPDPFGAHAGGRIYRSGDEVVQRPDGNFVFAGRRDQQVKIRGHRVELLEIENALYEHPAIEHAAMLAVQDSTGRSVLIAFVLPRAGMPYSAGEARIFMRSKLPDYMVPAKFVQLESMPRTVSGKIDRQALEQLQVPNLVDAEYIPPRTATEREVAGIWMDVLKVERVGVSDDFFELGGDSLLAMQVISHVREIFQVDLSIRAFFAAAHSMGELAELIEKQSEQSPNDDLGAVSSKVDVPADGDAGSFEGQSKALIAALPDTLQGNS
jgi:amino acid adenylation domain-containing protein